MKEVFEAKAYTLSSEARMNEKTTGYFLVFLVTLISTFFAFLLKDIVDVPGSGQMLVTSKEIDEDRGVYVIYVTDLEES